MIDNPCYLGGLSPKKTKEGQGWVGLELVEGRRSGSQSFQVGWGPWGKGGCLCAIGSFQLAGAGYRVT